jgi:hypothetical protein
MIVEVMINIIFGIVGLILSLFSVFGTIDTVNGFTNSIDTVGPYLAGLNEVLPITTIILILAFAIGFEVVYFGYIAIKWCYSKIPGLN